MTTRSLLVAVVTLAVLVAGSGAATGSTDVAVKKQRIAIEGTFSSGLGTGKFKLIPLTPGPLKKDSGTFKVGFSGTPIDPTPQIRNGQSVTFVAGRDDHTGKNGTFSVTQRLEIVSAGGSYAVVTGTWTFERGTGVYEGLAGGGAVAAIVLPGDDRFRHEGFLRGG